MILGTKARYAVMAMVDLASRDSRQPVTLADLAERQEIPLPYLEQIFSKLRREGLVQSARGPGGGYILARPSGEINVADIVSAVEESLQMTRCDKSQAGGCLSNKARCLTHELWEGFGNQIVNYLQGISLASVIARPAQEKIVCASKTPI